METKKITLFLILAVGVVLVIKYLNTSKGGCGHFFHENGVAWKLENRYDLPVLKAKAEELGYSTNVEIFKWHNTIEYFSQWHNISVKNGDMFTLNNYSFSVRDEYVFFNRTVLSLEKSVPGDGSYLIIIEEPYSVPKLWQSIKASQNGPCDLEKEHLISELKIMFDELGLSEEWPDNILVSENYQITAT